jgi:hypothetical protein
MRETWSTPPSINLIRHPPASLLSTCALVTQQLSLGHCLRSDAPWRKAWPVIQADVKAAVNEREHHAQDKAPEQLAQQQPQSRATAQNRLVRQPLQKRDWPKHPEHEAKREPEQPTPTWVIGRPLKPPAVEHAPKQHHGAVSKAGHQGRGARRWAERAKRPEPSEQRDRWDVRDQTRNGAGQQRPLGRTGIKPVSPQDPRAVFALVESAGVCKAGPI